MRQLFRAPGPCGAIASLSKDTRKFVVNFMVVVEPFSTVATTSHPQLRKTTVRAYVGANVIKHIKGREAHKSQFAAAAAICERPRDDTNTPALDFNRAV